MLVLLQLVGMIAMAFVILIRYEMGFMDLIERIGGRLAIWRKVFLFRSIVFILFFDILNNFAVAFLDAGLVLVPAPFALIGYLFCVRIAFSRF